MSEIRHEVEHHSIQIEGRVGEYRVAKVGRISSPPVRVQLKSDMSAASWLLEVFRCGKRTRAYADYAVYKKREREDPLLEWEAYIRAVRLEVGVERLEPLKLIASPKIPGPTVIPEPVTFHHAHMNDNPYIVASVGRIIGSPAAVYLLDDPKRSALDRLADVFRIGRAAHAYADFVTMLGGAGMAEDAPEMWDRYTMGVVRALMQRAISDALNRASKPDSKF